MSAKPEHLGESRHCHGVFPKSTIWQCGYKTVYLLTSHGFKSSRRMKSVCQYGEY